VLSPFTYKLLRNKYGPTVKLSSAIAQGDNVSSWDVTYKEQIVSKNLSKTIASEVGHLTGNYVVCLCRRCKDRKGVGGIQQFWTNASRRHSYFS